MIDASLHEWAFDDFRDSDIPDRLTKVNIRVYQGEQALAAIIENAVDRLQKVKNYATTSTAKLIKRYEFIKAGCWASVGPNPVFKPLLPRKLAEGFGKDQKTKLVKYETAPGEIASPIVPVVDWETAVEIYQRYNVAPLPGESFWDVVIRCNLPVALTEGLKKALALIANGLPAIALRGVTCWHKKGIQELHDELKPFVTQGRKIYIIFDQDEKPKTQTNVRAQVLKLGAILEGEKCKIFVPVWDPSEGKGVDDVMVRKEAPTRWLEQTLKTAMPLELYRKTHRVATMLSILKSKNRLSFPVERETVEEYLPELPPLKDGCIHVLEAPMNSGKTYRMLRDWIAQCRQAGILVIILAPLNSLGQQTAEDAGLPHIHDFGTGKDDQTALWATVRQQGGLVMCPNSLPRLPDWVRNGPICLFLDEANAGINHTLSGDTTSQRYQEITGLFAELCRQAIATGGIVMAEANIPDRAVKVIQQWTGVDSKRVRVFRHRKQSDPWDCTLYKGPTSGFRAIVIDRAEAGKKLLIVTSSQAEAARQERALTAIGTKVIRIDGETNEKQRFSGFFSDPDAWLQNNRPDVLILSPSARTGISIEGGVSAADAYFSEVWGYFPNLETSSHMQLLGRYRPAVPRHIYVPPFIMGTADEMLGHPDAIRERWNFNLKAIAKLAEVEAPQQGADEVASLEYLAESTNVSGIQKAIACDALADALREAGHNVTVAKVQSDIGVAKLWESINEAIWMEQAQKIADTTIDPEQHTLDWAREYLQSNETTEEGRIKANKVICRHQFPGVMFDESEECYQCLTRHDGKLARGVRSQVEAECPETLKALDIDEARRQMSGQYRALHRVPRKYIRALLLQKTGILELLSEETYTNESPKAIAIHQACLKYRDEILYWLRLQVKEDHTPVETVNKLLRKLGLDAEDIERRGGRGQQVRLWRIIGLDDPFRQRLIQAARAKFTPGSHDSLIRENPHLQVVTTGPHPPIQERRAALAVGSVVRMANNPVQWMVELVGTATARLRSPGGMEMIAGLDELTAVGGEACTV